MPSGLYSGNPNVGIDRLVLCRHSRRHMLCCSVCCLPPVHSCKRGVRISWSVSLKFSLRLMNFVRKSPGLQALFFATFQEDVVDTPSRS